VRAAAYPQPTFCHLFVRKLLIINDALRIMRRLVRLSMTKCGAERARVWQCGTNRQAAHPLALTGAGGLADCCRDCGPHAGRPLLRRGAGPGLQLPGRTGEPVGRPGSASPPTDNGFELRLCRRTGRCRQRGVRPGRPGDAGPRRGSIMAQALQPPDADPRVRWGGSREGNPRSHPIGLAPCSTDEEHGERINSSALRVRLFDIPLTCPSG
jgi:hypothetical protein